MFTADKPVIFNFHGYPWLIHKLTYRRTNQDRIHARGYKEKGNINTPLEVILFTHRNSRSAVIELYQINF